MKLRADWSQYILLFIENVRDTFLRPSHLPFSIIQRIFCELYNLRFTSFLSFLHPPVPSYLSCAQTFSWIPPTQSLSSHSRITAAYSRCNPAAFPCMQYDYNWHVEFKNHPQSTALVFMIWWAPVFSDTVNTLVYIYIYIYICVCVCVRVKVKVSL